MNVREPATAIGCPYCLEPLRAESMSGNVVADSMLASALTIQIRTAHAHSLVRLVSSRPQLKSMYRSATGDGGRAGRTEGARPRATDAVRPPQSVAFGVFGQAPSAGSNKHHVNHHICVLLATRNERDRYPAHAY